MSDQTINERTQKLLNTISEIRGDKVDSEIFKLAKDAPEKVRQVLASKSALEEGQRNNQSVKRSVAEILEERKITDSRTGETTVDILGADGKGFLSITEFDRDELKENLDAMLARAAFLEGELNSLQEVIEQKVAGADPAKVEATIDIRKNINLKNAVRRVFGGTKKSLTFEDYKQAVKLKARFDREEVAAAADDEVEI